MNVTYKLSATKPAGGILVEDCSSFFGDTQYPYRIDIFPKDNLSLWRSCDDAYYGTWMKDVRGDIRGLSSLLRWKLATTMGFCPHLRCQLGTVSHSPAYSQCPAGLCFTKLEQGAKSFGACCFDSEGVFDSGNLFGIANKSQSVPKPIYKHSAVRIRRKDPDLSASFINANFVHDGSLIVTQCPMKATAADALQMISQENIDLWIQIAPQSPTGRYSDCQLLHSLLPHFYADPSTDLVDIENSELFHQYVALASSVSPSHANFTAYTLPVIPPVITTPSFEIHLLQRSKEACVPHCATSRLLISVWFQQWTDFDAPSSRHFDVLRTVAQFAATMSLRNNRRGDVSRVAISCLSGRGRSGSMASLVAFLRDNGATAGHDAMVDIIVRLRSQRDGMVETPSQYRAVALLAGLPDPAMKLDASQPAETCGDQRQDTWTVFTAISVGALGRWPQVSFRQALIIAFVVGALSGGSAAVCLILCIFCHKSVRRHPEQ